MEMCIKLNNDVGFNLNADSYEYHCAGDFKSLGNGYLEVSNVYPTLKAVKYESKLLTAEFLDGVQPTRKPHRFWSYKGNTKVWLVEDDSRRQIDILNLSEICNRYRVLYVNVRLNTYVIKVVGCGDVIKRLDIMDIYLAEK